MVSEGTVLSVFHGASTAVTAAYQTMGIMNQCQCPHLRQIQRQYKEEDLPAVHQELSPHLCIIG